MKGKLEIRISMPCKTPTRAEKIANKVHRATPSGCVIEAYWDDVETSLEKLWNESRGDDRRGMKTWGFDEG